MGTNKTRPCPACHGAASRPTGRVGEFLLQRCSRCGTLFVADLPAEAEALDYGSYYQPGKPQIPAFVLTRLEQTVSTFDAYRSRNRWLDVGCGAGTLMRAAAACGWEVAGTEVAPTAVEAGRAAGLDVHLGEVGALNLPEASFDVVSMVEVVEHVPDPDAFLADAARLVRPGGALYLTTPHARGLSGRLLGTRWSVVAPPDHLQLFSVSGLRATLDRAHLTVRFVRTHAVNPYELVAALRGRGEEEYGDRKETSYRLNESLSSSRKGALIKTAANASLSAFRLGDSIKTVAERPG